MPMSRTALQVRELNASISGIDILKGVDLDVPFGEVHAIMGPNGSGKSTLCHVLAGKPGYEVSGAIAVDGAPIVELDVHERAQAGLLQALQYPVGIPGLDLAVLLEEAAGAPARKRRGSGSPPRPGACECNGFSTGP